MRNAWWHTQTEPAGHDSISELVASALRPVIEDLEARYNGGGPFPEIPELARPKAGPSGRARQARAATNVSDDSGVASGRPGDKRGTG
jgi:hypothetical protein